MLRQEAARTALDAAKPGEEAPVLVADPDAGQRRFMERVLRRGGFRSVLVASGEELLAVARRRRPRLVVLEVRLEGICGYEVCRALREEFGDSVGIIFLSRDRTDRCDRVAGLSLGADDYLGKPLPSDELLAHVRALARRAGACEHLAAAALRAGLTARELEVLHLLADGFDQNAIAGRLFITPKTVAKHIEHILTKLSARSRAEAISIAFRTGIHTPPSHGGRGVA